MEPSKWMINMAQFMESWLRLNIPLTNYYGWALYLNILTTKVSLLGVNGTKCHLCPYLHSFVKPPVGRGMAAAHAVEHLVGQGHVVPQW